MIGVGVEEKEVLVLVPPYIIPALSQNNPMYDISCPNNCFINLVRRLFVWYIITIYYLKLHTGAILNGVIGVEEEEVLVLVRLYISPALSQNNLRNTNLDSIEFLLLITIF